MATAEQVLAMMEMNAIVGVEHPYCIIDANSRKITVPDEYKLLGVESDENVERIYFKCPKIVGDGIDLSTLGLRINYQNANSQKDSYPVDDLTVENEFITFSWLLSRKAVAYKGTVKFIVCAVRIGDNAEISNEWNTTLASAEVLEGLEVDLSGIPDEEGKDLLEALIAQSQVKMMEVGEATEEAKRSAERADTAADRAEKAAEHAEGIVLGDISEKTVTFEMAAERAGVESGDSLAVAFGKLAKYCVDLKDYAFVDPVNNLLGTDATLPLAATQGKALNEKIEGVKSDVTELNGNLGKVKYLGTAHTGENGGTKITLPSVIPRNSMLLIVVRSYNGSTDLYPPYAFLVFVRPNAWRYTLIGEPRTEKIEINDGYFSLHYRSTEYARAWMYQIAQD